MTTRRLLWGMTWRGGVWGAATGVALSIIYSFLVALGVAIWHVWQPSEARTFTETLTSLVGLPFFGTCFAGVPFGIIVGAPFGATIGICSGILVAIVTGTMFAPLVNRYHYRRVVAVTSGIVAVFSVPAVVAETLKSPYFGFAYWTNNDTILYLVGPAILAMFAAIIISQRLARWYENNMQKQTS